MRWLPLTALTLSASALAGEPLFPGPARSELPPGLYSYAASLAAGRVAIGLSPLVAYEPSLRLLGFPEAHDNASARMVAGLFGVRDIGLGAVVLASTEDTDALGRAFLFNIATDLGDASVITAVMIRDGDALGPAGPRSLAFALGGAALWTAGWLWARR